MKKWFFVINLILIMINLNSFAAEKNNESDAARLWNLQDADILSVINEVSAETGKNFVVDPRVNGKISLISSKPIKPDEVYNVFLSILELLGYSAIPNGNLVKVVPNVESGEFATKIATNRSPGKGEEVVVRVIPLENISANQIIPVVRPMMPQWSNIAAYTPGNILILLGRAANLQRIVNVIRNIDQSSANQIDMVPLRKASAAQVAAVITNLQNAARATGDSPQVSVAADERSNSILINGNKSARSHMKFLIHQLDEPHASKQDNTEVVYLRYLKAKEVAPVIGKIAQHLMGKSEGTSANALNNMSKSKDPENTTNIQAEPSTNALVMTAPPAILHSLDNIIAKLDVRPAQVLIEGIIVEVNQDDINNLGILWGSLQTPPTNSTSTSSPSQRFAPGVFGIIPSQNIHALLTALQSKGGINILSTPSIVVLDNQNGLLSVGKEISEQSGSYATTGNTSTVSPFNTINRRPVALTLKVTPQINLGHAVRLKISLENDTLQNPENPGLDPVINISKIQNSVIINSEDILVLGGLMSNDIKESVNKIPLLGDIPVLGLVFQNRLRKLEKKSLMVFIKPTILHSDVDSSIVTHTKYDAIRSAQVNWPVDLSKPGQQKRQNILPLWKNNVALPPPFESQHDVN